MSAHPGIDATVAAADQVHLPPSQPPGVTLRRAWGAVTALAATAFLFVTNEIGPLGLITVMADGMGRSESAIGLVSTAFAAIVMVASVPLAMITTRLPRRSLLVATIAVFALGAFVQAATNSYAVLLTGRVVTAMAHAMFWAVVTPAAAGLFPVAVRGKSVSRLLVGPAFAGLLGLPAATWLAQRTEWQAPFLVLAVAGVVMAVVVAIVMPSYKTEEGSAPRGEIPLKGRFVRILAATLLTTAGLAITWTYITPYFVRVAGFSDEAVPVLLAIGGGVGLIAMWFSGTFIDRWPVRTVVSALLGMATLWAGLAAFGSAQWAVYVALVVQAVAWNFFVASMVVWAMRHSPWASDIGVATYAGMFNAGNAVGSLIGAWVLANLGPAWLPLVSFAAAVGAVTLVMTVPRRKRVR